LKVARILIVDDSPTVRSTVEWILHNQGHTVRVAGDGLDALHALHTFAPDLLLLDIRLPHIDGFQLCLVIRRMAQYASLPIVMISGLSGKEDIRHALDAGADDYIVKPIEDETLLQVIDQQLARTRLSAAHLKKE
jgi:DNA-binding response OmpR family regulator